MKTSFQKGFIIPLIGGIVALLIAGGIYWAWHNNNGSVASDAQNNIVVQNDVAASSTSNSSSSSANPDMGAGRGGTCPVGQELSSDGLSCVSNSTSTSDWKTYANSQYGFSVNYQSGLMQGIDGMSVGLPTDVGTPIIWFPAKDGSNGYGSGDIDIGISTSSMDISDCMTVPSNGMQTFKSLGNISVNGVTFIHFNSYQPALGQFRSTDSYRALHDGICWLININVDGIETNRLNGSRLTQATADYSQVQNELNADLQTFKFTN